MNEETINETSNNIEETISEVTETINNIEDKKPHNCKKKHKNQSLTALILSIISLLGVIFLIANTFSGKSKENAPIQASKLIGEKNISVAFVNNDTILANLDFVKDLRSQLESKGKKLQSDLAAQQKTLEKEAAYLDDAIRKNTISQESAQELYGKLMQKQQSFYQLQERYSIELQKEEMELNLRLIDTVMNFIERYNKDLGFDYVLGFNKGGNILYKNDSLDITKQVLEKMNKEYKNK